MEIDKIKSEAKSKMAKSVESLSVELAKMRAGRAHAGALDQVRVDCEGRSTPLSQIARIGAPSARSLSVAPYDRKMAPAIEKAIRDAGLGLSPFSQGDQIIAPIPALSEERRKEMVKLSKEAAEQARVAIRAIRRDANERAKRMKKTGDLSEDQERRCVESLQRLTDQEIAKVDQAAIEKEKEILTV